MRPNFKNGFGAEEHAYIMNDFDTGTIPVPRVKKRRMKKHAIQMENIAVGNNFSRKFYAHLSAMGGAGLNAPMPSKFRWRQVYRVDGEQFKTGFRQRHLAAEYQSAVFHSYESILEYYFRG